MVTVWSQLNFQGWASFCFKEKLKLLKGDIKRWQLEHSNEKLRKVNEAKAEMESWDVKAEGQEFS